MIDQNDRMLREVKMQSKKTGQSIRTIEEKARTLEMQLQKAVSGLRALEQKFNTDAEHLNEAHASIEKVSAALKDLERSLKRDKDTMDQMKTLMLTATQKYKEIHSTLAALKSSHEGQHAGVQKIEQTIRREEAATKFKKAA